MDVCRVLEEDPDLAGSLSGERLARARRDCRARCLGVPAGAWNGLEAIPPQRRGGPGLLILDGVLVRRVGTEHRYGAELLGPGDLLRPWTTSDTPADVGLDTTWRVVAPTTLALLDRRFAIAAAPFPEIGEELIDRALRRAHGLAVSLAIAHHPRLERRLLMILWHLADRWGRVTPRGVRVPLQLTHELLGELVLARRPSVTLNLQRLQADGAISREPDAWLLHGDPPEELGEAVLPDPVAVSAG